MFLLLEGGRERVVRRQRREFPAVWRRRPFRDDASSGVPAAADGTDSDHVGRALLLCSGGAGCGDCGAGWPVRKKSYLWEDT